jgi:hypothetical protein
MDRFVTVAEFYETGGCVVVVLLIQRKRERAGYSYLAWLEGTFRRRL